MRNALQNQKGKVLLVVGGSLFVCRHFLTFWTSAMDASPIALFGLSLSWIIAVAASVVSCGLIMLSLRKVDDVCRLPWLYMLGFGLVAVGLVVGVYAGWSEAEMFATGATVLLGLGNGIAFGVFILCHMREKPGDIIILLAAEFLLGSVLYALVRAIVPNIVMVLPTLVVHCVSAFVLYRYAKRVEGQSREDYLVELKPPAITFRQFLGFTFLFSATYGIVRTLTSNMTGSFDTEVLGIFVAAAGVLVVGLFRKVRSSESLIIVIIGIFAISFVSIPLYLLGIYAASLVHVLGFSMYLIICWGFAAFYLDDGLRKPVMVVGAAYISVQTGEMLGGSLMLAFSLESSMFLFVLSSALLFCLIGALMFIFLKQQRAKYVDYASYIELLAASCENLAVEYDLTSREREILILIAQKKSNGQIVQELFISQNTLKTHLRHIYTKMSVHNRTELLDLLEGSVV